MIIPHPLYPKREKPAIYKLIRAEHTSKDKVNHYTLVVTGRLHPPERHIGGADVLTIT